MRPPKPPSDLQAHLIPSLPPSMYYIPNFLPPPSQTQILTSLPPNRWITLTRRRLQAWPSTLSKTNRLLAAPLPNWLFTNEIRAGFEGLGVFKGLGDGGHGEPNHCLVNEYRAGEGIMPHEDGAAYWGCVATISLGASVVLDVYEKDGGEQGERGESGTDENGNDGNGTGDTKSRQTTSNGTSETISKPLEPKPASIEPSSTDSASTASASTDPSTAPSHRPNPRWRIYQEPGSLLITTGPLYTSTLHGISDITVDENLKESTIANWNMLEQATRERIESNGGRSERGTRTSLTFRDVVSVSGAADRVLGRGRKGKGR